MEYKIKFQRYDLEEYSSALRDCENILYEIVDDSDMDKYHDEALKIVKEIGELANKIESRLDYENLTKDDIESIKADERYVEAKERFWRDRE